VVIVIVLVVVLVLVPLALWGLSRLRAARSQGGEKSESRSSGRIVGAAFTLVMVGFGIALPLLILTGNHSHASAKVGNVKLTQGEKNGRELFGQHCGVCHTLSAASAIGKVGPNLDLLRPPASLVLHTIDNGCLPNASGATASEVCLGQGVMPADVVTGQDAQDVAGFVAAVTGHPPSRAPAAANTTATATTAAPAPTTSSITSTTPPPAGGAPPSGATQKLALAADPSGQLKFDKTTLTAKAGKVQITFTNDSPVPHNVTVQSGTSGPAIAATPTFSKGSKTITMTLKPGKYTYYCSVPGHREAGMLGTLTVS
jgi:plastocyanin